MKVLTILGEVSDKMRDSLDELPKNNDVSIQSILNFVYAIVALVAVGFIVYAGVSYVMSEGDPGRIKKASQTIAYAVIGLVIVLFAALLTNFVIVNLLRG